MNKPDKEWYKALKFLSRLSLDKFTKLEKNNPKLLRKYVSEELQNTLELHEFIKLKEGIYHVITKRGLNELRMLEDIARKDITFFISIIAIIISIIAFSKSMGRI
jgi:hypothetical protein